MKQYVINVDAEALEKQNEKKVNKDNTLKNNSFDVRNYLDTKLGKDENSKMIKVRLLPISANDGNVFFEIKTHSLKVSPEIAKSGFKSYVCLNDSHVGSGKCPICEKSKELLRESYNTRSTDEIKAKTLYKEGRSYESKKTYIVRVIDRAHEDEGVKFWRFNENSLGEGIYDKLYSLYKTRKKEYAEAGQGDYSIFDLYNGKDIIINISKALIPDGHGGVKEKISYNITDAGIQTPLSDDIETANKWITDKKTWRDVYSLKSCDYLQLVVDGKIPVYDSNKGCYVDKVVLDKEREVAENGSSILQDNSSYKEEDNEELPF